MLILLHMIKFLARQGLPFCGHRKDIETTADRNFLQLLLFQAEDCQELESWIRRKEYIFPDYCIMMMGNTILRSILNDIKTSNENILKM